MHCWIETNFCFKDLRRVFSLQQWPLHCNRLESEGATEKLSLPIMCKRRHGVLEYLKFEWVRTTSKSLYIFPVSQQWASSARGKTELKKLVGSIWKYKSDILITIHLFYLNSNKQAQLELNIYLSWVVRVVGPNLEIPFCAQPCISDARGTHKCEKYHFTYSVRQPFFRFLSPVDCNVSLSLKDQSSFYCTT